MRVCILVLKTPVSMTLSIKMLEITDLSNDILERNKQPRTALGLDQKPAIRMTWACLQTMHEYVLSPAALEHSGLVMSQFL